MNILKGNTTWVDMVRPTEKDLAWLKTNFKLHPIIIDELRGPSARARVEAHKNCLYFIYYFPIYDSHEQVSKRSEIDFLITKGAVITVRYEENEVFTHLRKTLRSSSRALEDSLRLIHKLLVSLLEFQERQLAHIREKADAVSGELFKEREREREKTLLEKISYLKRDISQYRLIVRPQRQILDSFARVGCEFLGANCSIYMNDLIGEHIKILDQLEDYRQAVEDFEDTNIQLINVKNAQVVKTFTILAFLTFPMMLFAAIFSMNTINTPIVGQPGDFWILFGIMVIAMVGMYKYFRDQDWL